MDMPLVALLVLDGLADDFESVESLRDSGEVAPYGLALACDRDVVAGVRFLLQERLIEAWAPTGHPAELVAQSVPATDDASLHAYWFRWTAAGERVWRERHAALGAYYKENPPAG